VHMKLTKPFNTYIKGFFVSSLLGIEGFDLQKILVPNKSNITFESPPKDFCGKLNKALIR
jgi:hypothetical protein